MTNGVPVEAVRVATFGVVQLMHKDERGDLAWTTSFMHINKPPAQVTEGTEVAL